MLALIWRIDSPAAKRNRRISRIFRIVILLAAMASLQKAREDSKRLKEQCVGMDSGNVNSDSGMLNTDSGKTRKVFSLVQNECSRSARIGVHVESEWVFRMGQIMHKLTLRQSHKH